MSDAMSARCRGSAVFFLGLIVSAGVVLSQTPDTSSTPNTSSNPQRPLRERLLERALKGDAEAQFELAKDYEGGRIGLPQDLNRAQHWYREAANHGDPFAQASLGLLYVAGKGVERDYILAYMWLERAASNMTGAERDTVMETRDSIGRRITSAQITEARRMAKESALRQ